MNDKDRPYLLCRQEQDAHRATLAIVHSKTLDAYDRLVAQVYGHQRAAYPPNTGLPIPPCDHPHSMAKYFYEHCYIKPNLRLGLKIGRPVDVDEFVNTVAVWKNPDTRNNVYFLHGEVGTGKTSFINYLMTTVFPPRVKDHNLWFVRIDVEDLATGGIDFLKTSELLFRTCIKAKQVLSQHPDIWDNPKVYPAYQNFLTAIGGPGIIGLEATNHQFQEQATQKALFAFHELANSILNHTQRRLLLIFDNLDYVCHLHDRALFYKEENPDSDIIAETARYVEAFHHEAIWGHLGANVLFVIRSDTYDFLLLKPRTTSREPIITSADNRDAFYLERSEWKDVLNCRNDLLVFTADAEPVKGRRSTYLSITDTIIRHLVEGTPPLLEHVLRLSNYGYRQMMRFFAQYGWATESGDLAIQRFIHQYPVGLLTFILDQHLLFNQFRTRFPNIYLSRMLEWESAVKKEYSHPHTYWLKRLICELVRFENTMEPQDIIAIFRGQGRGYKERLIKETLGSLSDANCSNMLKVLRSPHPYQIGKYRIASVQLSERGSQVLEHVVDRFFYLQLIVDDDLMPIPMVLSKEFDFKRLGQLDYSYVTKPGEAYSDAALQMVSHKAKLVLLFLEVLDVALECERSIYDGAFKLLEARSRKIIPNVSAIREGILGELVRLAESHPSLNVATIKGIVSSYKEGIRNQVRQLYAAGETGD